MYEQYLKLSHIPLNAILKRIMTKEGISQSQLAVQSGIVRQRICDYLANRRRITVEASLNLEKALNIDIKGFFYKIQANHDVYTYSRTHTESRHPNLSCYRKALFWDTQIENLNWQDNHQWIIQRVFEYGNEKEILETVKFYGKKYIISTLREITDSRKSDIRNDNINKYLE